MLGILAVAQRTGGPVDTSETSVMFVKMHTEQSGDCASPFINAIEVTGTETAYVSWFDPFHESGKTYELEIVETGQSSTGIPDITGITEFGYTLQDLASGTQYDLYIRASCESEYSIWNGPVRFSTFIDNAGSCNLALPVTDNNCPEEQVYTVFVDNYPGMILGDNIFIRSISLIIDHNWVADLSVGIMSPTGMSASLSADHGVGETHFGNPSDTSCAQSLRFTMEACDHLTEENSPYTGEFIPDEDINILHDGGPADGNWKLVICDKAQDDIGTLKFVRIEFVEDLCLLAPGAELYHASDSMALFHLFGTGCDSIRVSYGAGLTEPGGVGSSTVVIPCTDFIQLQNLSPQGQYGVYFQNICGSDTSGWSCLYTFETSCAPITLEETFDILSICEPVCGVNCQVNGLWDNGSDDDFDWTVWEGPTPTSFTGPEADFFGHGRYLFIESSAQACQDSATASLTSKCLALTGDPEDCHLSFAYHMAGANTGKLQVELSLNDGETWIELFNKEGEQDAGWQMTSLNLSPYFGNIGKLRISAITGHGAFGDIAIDEIRLHGPLLADSASMQYYVDNDNDNFGNPNLPVCICSSTPLDGFSVQAGDCNDDAPMIYPGAQEIPCNLIDENCNGNTDDAQENPPDIQLIDQQDETCNGANDGVLEFWASGGDGPYIFDWGPGLSPTARIEQLSAGVYQCTITDINGCVITSPYYSVNIEMPIEYFLLSLELPSCPGVNDGALTGIVQGGTPPYTYLWNTGDTTLDLNGIGNGNYIMTATDQLGCTHVSSPVTVHANPTFQIGVLTKKDVSCHGANNGSITLGQIGGIPPFSYSWNNGANTQMIGGLAPGNYVCTVTDANGCQTDSDTIFIRQPDSLTIQITALDAPGCPGGNDGRIEIAVNGGAAPYFYRWSNGKFTDDLFFIPAGIYSVTVTDARNCELVLNQILLIDPPDFEITIDSIAQVLCPGDDQGYISVSTTGGTPPYQYFWSNGVQSGNSNGNLQAGNYAVTISDQNGCKASLDGIVIEPASNPISLNIQSVDSIDCFGDSTAQIVIEANGGTGPYWFNWSAGAEHYQQDNIDTITMLPAGNYRVTVTDSKGCVGSYGPVLISQPQKLQYQLAQIQHNQCFGYSEGSISLQVSGGTPPLSFQWNNGDQVKNISQLEAGIYKLTITDVRGCNTVTAPFTITQPDSVFLHFETMSAVGGQMNGWAEVSISGAIPPFQYQWNTQNQPSQDPRLSNIGPGWYTVTITDGGGCIYTDSIFVDIIDAVSEFKEQDGVNVYPNPGTGRFYVEFLSGSTRDFKEIDLALIDGSGKCYSIHPEFSSDGFSFDISKLPGGAYYLITGKRVIPLIKVSQ